MRWRHVFFWCLATTTRIHILQSNFNHFSIFSYCVFFLVFFSLYYVWSWIVVLNLWQIFYSLHSFWNLTIKWSLQQAHIFHLFLVLKIQDLHVYLKTLVTLKLSIGCQLIKYYVTFRVSQSTISKHMPKHWIPWITLHFYFIILQSRTWIETKLCSEW